VPAGSWHTFTPIEQEGNHNKVTGTAHSEVINVHLRQAVSEDEDFLLQLFLATQPMETASWNMSAIAREQLLQMQFQGRRQTYAAQYPDAEDLIICLNEEGDVESRVGRHLVMRQEDAILGIDLAVLPAYQKKGLGGLVLQGVQRQCAKEGLRFRLQVLHTNPARRLYDRLGFRMVSQDLLYVQMEWSVA
jgi:GNAT superfamily N-acetyltransferase